MKTLKLLFRPKVLRAVIALVTVIGDATADRHLTRKERSDIMSAAWHLIRVYQGQP